MARMVRTSRFSGVKDTNTAMFDQNGRRITGDRPTLAAGETVVKRGNAPSVQRPSATRVSSTTRMTATISRPARGAKTPIQETYEPEEEQVDYEDERRAERRRAAEEEKAERNYRKEKETIEFHTKYYELCKDKEKLEAYPGYRFGMEPPDPADIHALGVYKMNLAEYEKQEAKQKRVAEAKSAAQAARGTISRSGRPPPRTQKTPAPGQKGKTPGRKTEDQLMEELYEKHADRLNKQTHDFHNKYYPLCRDKVLLEAYPGFRFGMPVPEYDDLLAVNGYMLELRAFEEAEEAAKKAKPAAKTKAQKEKEERDARIAAKRVSLRPPSRKPGHVPRTVPHGVQDTRAPGPPLGGEPRRAAPKPEPEPRRGPPPVARGPPPWYRGPLTIGGDGQPITEPEPQPGTEAASNIEIATETKVVIEKDMETRIFNLKQKAFEKGVYKQPPPPTPAMRARLTPSPEPKVAVEVPPPRPQPSGLQPPGARGIPQRAGSQIGRGGPPPATRGLVAKPVTAVNVVNEEGVSRSIFVPTKVATASHDTVVAVRKGTNVATPIDEIEGLDVDGLDLGGFDDNFDDTLTFFPPVKKNVRQQPTPTLDAFDQMRQEEERERQREELEKRRAAVAKLRQAAQMLHQQKRDLDERVEAFNIAPDLDNMVHFP